MNVGDKAIPNKIRNEILKAIINLIKLSEMFSRWDVQQKVRVNTFLKGALHDPQVRCRYAHSSAPSRVVTDES